MHATPITTPAFQFRLDAATRYADAAIAGIERLARLELHVAWDWLALAREQATSLLGHGNGRHDAWPALVQRAALRFNRNCLDTASLHQTQLLRIAAEQAAALQCSWLIPAPGVPAAVDVGS